MLNLRAALQSLREQWHRAVLSATGIMVGSLAIVLLVSIATGVRADITGQVHELGVNTLVVIPGRIEDGTFNPNLGGASYLKEVDAQRLSKVPGVVRAEPFSFVGGGIRRGNKTATPMLAACTEGWFQMRPVRMQEGHTFAGPEEKQDVVVLGSIAKDQLFGKANSVGEKVQINGRSYTVIGVTEDKKQEQSLFSFGSLQNLVYVPYHRLKTIEPDLPTSRIMVQAATDAEPKQLLKTLDASLGERLDRQMFQVLTQEDLLGLVFKLMGILTWLLTGLTSIALFVGGVGIMTVMLMSVNERAKEIGIRKTVGARRKDIFQQFLFEAIVLAIMGCLAGLLLSWVVSILLTQFTPIKPMITPQIITLAFAVCLGVGCVFGLLPAASAARKDPVAALRME